MAINSYYPSTYNAYPYGNAGIAPSGSFTPQGTPVPPNGYNYTPNASFNAQNGNFAQQAAPLAGQAVTQQGNNSNVPWVYVPSIESAKQIFCAPSQTIYIMNQNQPEFYVKSANEMGVVDMKICPFNMMTLTEYEQGKTQAATQANNTDMDFLPRAEFNQFASNVSQELNTVRQILSGTAQFNGTAPQATPKTASKKMTKENVE